MRLFRHNSLTSAGLLVAAIAYIIVSVVAGLSKWDHAGSVVIAGAALMSACVASYISGRTKQGELEKQDELRRADLTIIYDLLKDSKEALDRQREAYRKTASNSVSNNNNDLGDVLFSGIITLQTFSAQRILKALEQNETKQLYSETIKLIHSIAHLKTGANEQWMRIESFYNDHANTHLQNMHRLNSLLRDYTYDRRIPQELREVILRTQENFNKTYAEGKAKSSKYEYFLHIHTGLLHPLLESFINNGFPAEKLELRNTFDEVEVSTSKLISIHEQIKVTFENYDELGKALSDRLSKLISGIEQGKIGANESVE